MNYGDIELLGDLDDDELLGDDDDMGLALRIPSRRITRRSRARKRRVIRRALVPNVPGSPRPGAREWPLGFPVATFTAASGTSLSVTAQPQRAFKGSRLVVDIARTGATATGLISISRFFVGQINQLVSAQPVGAGSFAPNSFHTTLSVDPATPGVDITLTYDTSVAPTAPDQIDVGTTVIGLALG